MNIDNFLEFDYGGRYKFARCEGCDGPLLRHLEVKCKGKEGARYESATKQSLAGCDCLERSQTLPEDLSTHYLAEVRFQIQRC